MTNSNTTSSDLLQSIADREAIRELIYRYCRAVDRIDHALGHSIWHEDGIADYGAYYKGNGRGVIDLICSHHQHLLYHSHQISNILIDLGVDGDGDRASSEAYVTANLRMAQDGQFKQISVWSRYIDQWSRRNGRWGIDKRVVVRDFDEIRDVTPMSDATEGSRDSSDPSYVALRAST